MTAAECRQVADNEFADVRSLADIPRLTPERLRRFRDLIGQNEAAIKRRALATNKEA